MFVSSGDAGAASSDANGTKATHGIGVSGFTSTPYNVSVGGTDFGDSYAGVTSNYWSGSNGADLRLGAFLHSGNSLERFVRERV